MHPAKNGGITHPAKNGGITPSGYYPADLARCFRPFVDLLLTRGLERKKPPLGAALKHLM